MASPTHALRQRIPRVTEGIAFTHHPVHWGGITRFGERSGPTRVDLKTKAPDSSTLVTRVLVTMTRLYVGVRVAVRRQVPRGGERGPFAPALLVARPALTGFVPLTRLIVSSPHVSQPKGGQEVVLLRWGRGTLSVDPRKTCPQGVAPTVRAGLISRPDDRRSYRASRPANLGFSVSAVLLARVAPVGRSGLRSLPEQTSYSCSRMRPRAQTACIRR